VVGHNGEDGAHGVQDVDVGQVTDQRDGLPAAIVEQDPLDLGNGELNNEAS
jgi:hypothetical protein